MKLVDVDNLGIAKADIEILGDASYVYGWNSALQVVTETNHTIDPETLPIVQTLKRQVQEAESEAQYCRNNWKKAECKLAQVIAERDALKSNPPVEIDSDAFELATRLAEIAMERDAAIDFAGRLLAICTPPKEWEPKLFRKIIRGIGDYMGTGYAFLDAFYKEYDDFQESDSTGVLRDILAVADRKRKSKREV